MLDQILGYTLLTFGAVCLLYQTIVLLRSRGANPTLWQFVTESASVIALGGLHLYVSPLQRDSRNYRDSCQETPYTKYLIFAMSLVQCSISLMLYNLDCFKMAAHAPEDILVETNKIKINRKKCQLYRLILIPIVMHCLLVVPLYATDKEVFNVSLDDFLNTECPELMQADKCETFVNNENDTVNIYRDVITHTIKASHDGNSTEQINDIIAKIRQAVHGFNETNNAVKSFGQNETSLESSKFYLRPHDFNLNTTLMARRPKMPVKCITLCTSPRGLMKIHVFATIMFGFVIPIFISILFYVKLIHVSQIARDVDDALSKQNAFQDSKLYSRRKIRNAKSSIIVSLFLWSPAIMDIILKDLICVTKSNVEIDNLFYLVANAYFVVRESLNLYVTRSHQLTENTITPN